MSICTGSRGWLLSLLLALPLAAESWVSGELSLNYPPIYFELGAGPRGIYADLKNAILDEAGIAHRTEYLSSKRLFRDIWRARLHLNCCSNPGWWVGWGSDELIDPKAYSQPVVWMRDIWVFRRGRAFDPERQLTGKRIGLIRGFGYRELDERQFSRIDFDSSDDLIHALIAGEVQAIILNEFVFGWWMSRRGFPLEAGPMQDQVALSFLVHPKAAALMPQINAAITRLQARGALEALIRGYLPEYQAPEGDSGGER